MDFIYEGIKLNVLVHPKLSTYLTKSNKSNRVSLNKASKPKQDGKTEKNWSPLMLTILEAKLHTQ